MTQEELEGLIERNTVKYWRTREVKITPELASALLEFNPSYQRKLSSPKVDRYAKQMKNGKWALDGETVILSDGYALLDGQHRMNAVVKAQIPVNMLVLDGVNPDAFPMIDQGAKHTAKDILDIKDIPNAAVAASSIRQYNKAKKQDRALYSQLSGSNYTSANAMTDDEVLSFYQRHEDVCRELFSWVSGHKDRMVMYQGTMGG